MPRLLSRYALSPASTCRGGRKGQLHGEKRPNFVRGSGQPQLYLSRRSCSCSLKYRGRFLAPRQLARSTTKKTYLMPRDRAIRTMCIWIGAMAIAVSVGIHGGLRIGVGEIAGIGRRTFSAPRIWLSSRLVSFKCTTWNSCWTAALNIKIVD
jgi:hypothetical protein